MEWIIEAEDLTELMEGRFTLSTKPLVRCKDCKYNVGTHKCLQPDSFFLVTKEDDYCSYGERRTDAT